MAGTLKVNRDVFAKFLPDHETIIQFEDLFAAVNSIDTGDDVDDNTIAAENAIAKANSAISQLSKFIKESFETVNENLKDYAKTLTYTGFKLTSVTYTLGSKTITKTLSYTGLKLTSIVLSGDTPGGINLSKSFTYSGLNLTGVTYS